MKILWEKYDNFYDLWNAKAKKIQLIYIIGEAPNVYIGSIGANGGKGGIKNRYQKQYIDRARAIFGKTNEEGKLCYAGTFQEPKSLSKHKVLLAELEVQHCFINKYGEKSALFRTPKTQPSLAVTHLGKIPDFL